MALISDNYFQYKSAMIKLKTLNSLDIIPEKQVDDLLEKMHVLWNKLTWIEKCKVNGTKDV